MLNRKGFTLVELLIVIIIVGILAAASIPMMTGNVQRARSAEAIAAMGAIRTQMRLGRTETGSYLDQPPAGAGAENFTGGVKTFILDGNDPDLAGFVTGDLTGAYYNDADYSVTVAAADDSFTINCEKNEKAGTAPATQMAFDGSITYP